MQRVCVHASLVPLYCGSQEVVKLGSDQTETLQVLTRSKGCRLDSHRRPHYFRCCCLHSASASHSFTEKLASAFSHQTTNEKKKRNLAKTKKKKGGGVFHQQIQSRGKTNNILKKNKFFTKQKIKSDPIFPREK